MNFDQKYLFILAISGHLVLLLLFCLKLNNQPSKINLGEAFSIHSYFYQENLPQEQKVVSKDQAIDIKSKALILHPTRIEHTHSEKPKQIMLKEGNGQPISELIAILHAAIQAQQHYPESALQMERTGQATLSFLLFPNGLIQNLHIIKSSGTETLDEAAIAAVQMAKPFKGVEQYIHQPQEYQINVVFELG